MNQYSEASKANLVGVHPDLILLFATVLPDMDHSIVSGVRTLEEQKEKFDQGLSKLIGLQSKHVISPQRPLGMALDVGPYDHTINAIPWPHKHDTLAVRFRKVGQFYFFAGWVLKTAQILLAEGKMTHKVRYGGDWNQNTSLLDNNFDDIGHFELVE